MSLEALAPDQRAVVQLVLQQDRSYEDLAGLLQIPAEAVRERAHRGLERLVAPGELDAGERAAVADYLLGQQTVSEREATRALLGGSAPARAWARALSGELSGVARGGLPGVPDEPGATSDAQGSTDFEPDGDGSGAAAARGRRDAAAEPVAEAAEPEPAAAQPERSVPARPRPRRERAAAAPASAAAPAQAGGAEDDAAEDSLARSRRARPGDGASGHPRSSRLGGILLLAAGVIALVVVVVLLVNRGDDGDKASDSAKATATATATATPEFQPIAQVPLRSPSGAKASGRMVIFASSDGGVAFTIQATGVPASGAAEAYAVWLTGGGGPHRLGFAPQVTSNGKLGASGPREQDTKRFATWLTKASRVVVSRETSQDGTEPGPIVLQGRIKKSS